MRFLAALLTAFILAGCTGYHVGAVKPTPMKNVRRICVKNFKNDTLEPRVEVFLANALIKQLQQDGTYEITDEGRADAILTATLMELERRPARSLRGNILQTREYLLYLRCRYKVADAKTGIVLDERNVLGSTSYFVTGENLLSADLTQDERQAIPIAAEDLAVRITSLVSEGW
jgi:outer membrane lipopolysaccharide assembly protein LptE/RlpB